MKKILPWVFSIFCGLCVFAYIPHFSALIFAVGCILSLPIPKIREFLGSKGLSGKFKGVLLSAILFAGIMATPTAPKIQGPNETVRDVTNVDESEPNEPKKDPEKSNKEESTSGSAQNKQDSAEKQIQTNAEAPEGDVPVPEPTHEPLQEPSPEVQPKPEPEPERTIRGRSSNTIVYVSKRSNTIHSVNDCGGMKNYREMTLGEADGRGYDYCPNCW